MAIRRKKNIEVLTYNTTPSSINSIAVWGVIGLLKYRAIARNTVTGATWQGNNTTPNVNSLGIGNASVVVFELSYRFQNFNKVTEVRIANSTFSTIPDSVLQFNYDILKYCYNITNLMLTYGTSSFFSDKTVIDVSNRKKLLEVHSNDSNENGYGQLDQLQNLDVSGCSSLELLYLYSRNPSSGNHTLTNLNLTGCVLLKRIYGQKVFGNFTLNVDECVALEELYLFETKINGINFGNISMLKTLGFYQPYNNLTTGNRVESLDLTNFASTLITLELLAAGNGNYLTTPNIAGWDLLVNTNIINVSNSDYNFRNNIQGVSTSFLARNEPSMNLSYCNPQELLLSGIGLLTPTYRANYDRLTKFISQNQQIDYLTHFFANFYSSSSLLTEINLSANNINDNNTPIFSVFPNLGACTIWLVNCNMTWIALEWLFEYFITSNKTNITLNLGPCTGFVTGNVKANQNAPLQDIFPSGYRYDLAKATLISRGWSIVSTGIISDSFIGTNMTFLTSTTVNQKGNFIVYDSINTPISNIYTVSGDAVNLPTVGLSEIKYQAFDGARIGFGFTVTNMTKCVIRQGDMRSTDINGNLQLTEMYALGDTYSTAVVSVVGFFGIRNNPNLTTLYIRGVDMSGTQPSSAFQNFATNGLNFDLSGNALSSTIINNVLQRFLNRGGTYPTWTGTIKLNGGTNGVANPTLVSALQTMYPLYTILVN